MSESEMNGHQSDSDPGLTRRDFLWGTAAAGVFAAVAGGPFLLRFSRDKRAPADIASQWFSSTCQGCTSWCPVQVEVANGRAIRIRGNPHSRANHGEICPRPHLALQQVYDADRIKTPMKRTNPEKGRDQDPGFVPISWDEALDTIADRMMALRAKGEPHKFAVLRGRYSYVRDIIYAALPKVFGSPNGISHSAICAEAEKFGSYYTEGLWDYRDYDLEHTRYVLCWGADPLASNRQVPHAMSIWGQVRDNATIAVIDPRLSSTAAKADEWLPVIPGEDGALAVAIAHTILVDGLWNREFVGDFSDGSNRFEPGKTVDLPTWNDEDETAARAQAPDEKPDENPAEKPAQYFREAYTHGLLTWWNLELKDRTPEWAEPICGIPAEQIRRVARGFAAAAPAAISWLSPGASMQVRGSYAALAAHALNGLVGSCDNRGGTARASEIPKDQIPAFGPYQDELAKERSKEKKIDQRGTLTFPSLKQGKSGGGVVTNNVADAMLARDPYGLEVVIGYWCNFTFSCSGTQRWEQALAELPFFAHITTHASEMSFFADIVLPAAHQLFEKWSFLPGKQNLHAYVTLTQPMLEPMWDVRQDETEVPYLLAQKLADRGFDNLWRYFNQEFNDPETGAAPADSEEFARNAVKICTRAMWDGTHENWGRYGDAIDGWDAFVERGVWNSKRYQYRTQWGRFGTVTRKFEFYSATLEKALGAHAKKHGVSVDEVLEKCDYAARGERAFIPHFEPALRDGDPEEYPLVFFEHRSRLNREGRSANCTWYQAHKNADPGDENWDDVLKMNPADAATLGLADRDEVRVISPRGEIKVRLKLWQGVRPGTVTKCFGQGHWAYGRVASLDFQRRIPRGGNNNEILPPSYDRLSGSTARHGGCTRVKVVRA